ncbi:CarD family transcriptional regulator [Bacillus sp. V5-8f]|uniref:CarD family transcriptional regulator n=1 Tax=Bacillus sp. V5-8f TaxID=2053044 RepID=UPI000C78374F|nr:CarD family transcriptional regulator [Bacillus sp. V5-8f]PLT32037.1 transcription factor YdeB [Bacillus sp. V5-8f]
MEVDYLFQIGDNIIYPMHGAGVIEGIEEKEIQGQTQKYYVIKMLMNNMQVLIPIKNVTNLRIRSVSNKISMKNILDIVHQGESDRSLSWKQRYQINSEKMRSGKLQEGAEVVRDLTRIKNEKTLNSSEKQMLENAKKILVGELGLIRGITEVQATDLLKTIING